MEYYLVGSQPPQGALAGEDCISMNPNAVSARLAGSQWKTAQGNVGLLDHGDSQIQALRAVEYIQKYAFTQMCFVGRPFKAPFGMTYFRQ